MTLKLRQINTKSVERAVENNLDIFDNLEAEEQAQVSIPFFRAICKILDAAAVGDAYVTVGSTRSKTALTFSLAVNGNRETIYKPDAINLLMEASQWVLEESEETEPF